MAFSKDFVTSIQKVESEADCSRTKIHLKAMRMSRVSSSSESWARFLAAVAGSSTVTDRSCCAGGWSVLGGSAAACGGSGGGGGGGGACWPYGG